jgi:hypothetical protein
MKKKLNKISSEFPNIFRTIPESKLFKKGIRSKTLFYLTSGFALAIILMLISVIAIVGVGLYKNTNLLVQTINQRSQIQNKINFWQSIADKYEGYKDAYFQIAVLEYKLGDSDKARLANTKALILDPNFEDAKRLGSLLDR